MYHKFSSTLLVLALVVALSAACSGNQPRRVADDPVVQTVPCYIFRHSLTLGDLKWGVGAVVQYGQNVFVSIPAGTTPEGNAGVCTFERNDMVVTITMLASRRMVEEGAQPTIDIPVETHTYYWQLDGS